jgi:hypothetical protein
VQMGARRSIQKRRSEAGIALLIAIFVLLLISVMAIALIVSSGTESALAGNYRSSTGVYYAAVAGLEEVRARLRSNNPNSFKNTAPGFLPPSGTPLAVCSPVYVINPVGGEAVAPWDPANAYYDSEFGPEYAGICGPPPSPSPSTLSVWNRSPLNSLPFSGPLYKWVRINGVSEQSLNLDTYPAYDGIDSKLVYYDSTHLNDMNSGSQVLEITALAVLPNGSQKLLQYLVAPVPVTLPPFLAALTLSGSPGNSATFQPPANNSSYAVMGDDQDCSGSLTGSKFASIGVFTNGDVSSVKNSIIYVINYQGVGSGVPDVENIDTNPVNGNLFPANLEIPSQLDAIAQSIAEAADVVIPSGMATYPLPTVDASQLDTAMAAVGMSSSNPVTVVVNGNLDISNWGGTGYGLLLVIGTLTYDPSTTWNGIVLVIGQGAVTNSQPGINKQVNGAVLVAKTRDSSGGPWGSKLGGASVAFDPTMQGFGIRYSSCWIQKARPTASYKILSFHEIAQ